MMQLIVSWFLSKVFYLAPLTMQRNEHTSEEFLLLYQHKLISYFGTFFSGTCNYDSFACKEP
jgi:predicted transglutaminase-like protease